MSIFTGKILGFEHRHFSVLVIWQAIICNFGPQVLKISTPIKGADRGWLINWLRHCRLCLRNLLKHASFGFNANENERDRRDEEAEGKHVERVFA